MQSIETWFGLRCQSPSKISSWRDLRPLKCESITSFFSSSTLEKRIYTRWETLNLPLCKSCLLEYEKFLVQTFLFKCVFLIWPYLNRSSVRYAVLLTRIWYMRAKTFTQSIRFEGCVCDGGYARVDLINNNGIITFLRCWNVLFQYEIRVHVFFFFWRLAGVWPMAMRCHVDSFRRFRRRWNLNTRPLLSLRRRPCDSIYFLQYIFNWRFWEQEECTHFKLECVGYRMRDGASESRFA